MLYSLFILYCCFHRVLLSFECNVQIKQGPTIIGLTQKTEDHQKTFHSFRGIPYAMPPTGDQRFKPPVSLSKYASVIKAYDEGPSCAQSVIPLVTIGEEDCLYLNVYTPILKCDTLLPVMVWFHGGFFEIGGHTYQTYHPDYFINENVVVVTINYRLNILGFLSTEDMEAPGNYGLKDQILALKWVKEHIKNFCGNESNITVFGESAGSISVSYLTQTSLTKGLFHRAILQSGTSLCPWGLTRNPKLVAFGIGRMLNLNTSSSASLIHDLRSIDYKELIAAATYYQLKTLLLDRTFDGFVFGPSIEPQHDDAVLTTPSHYNLLNGGYHTIPYIIGFNSGEALPFIKVIGEHISLYLHRFKSIPTALVPVSMNISNQLKQLLVNRKVKSYYFQNQPDKISILNYFNDNEFIRPILESVRLYSVNSSVFMYVFSYKGSFDTPIIDTDTGLVGHGEELSYLFRNTFVPITLNEKDQLTRYRLIKLWTNFAKTGNPTPEKNMLFENVIWQNSKSISGMVYLDIGTNISLRKDFQIENYQFWNSLFNLYGNPPFSTY